MSVLIGCDPEVFLFNDKGIPISGHGIVPGTKEEPYHVRCGAIQLDGMAAEINIDPSADSATFVVNIAMVMHSLKKLLPRGVTVDISPVTNFNKKYMDEQPESTKVLGCDPDYCAWTGMINPRPNQHPTMRTAAGHLHIGWTNGEDLNDPAHMSSCIELVKQLDYYVGMYCTVMDKDTKRKEMYGKAGAFRFKPYGCEYRVPSNFWLKDEKTVQIFTIAKLGFDQMVAGNVASDRYGDEAVSIINNNDSVRARQILGELGIVFGG